MNVLTVAGCRPRSYKVDRDASEICSARSNKEPARAPLHCNGSLLLAVVVLFSLFFRSFLFFPSLSRCRTQSSSPVESFSVLLYLRSLLVLRLFLSLVYFISTIFKDIIVLFAADIFFIRSFHGNLRHTSNEDL